ncbi:DUF2633 family protein [Flavobacterium petrolei]|uniref:DUF2633 family protein n=1 Tax=Flavobacterium petrolei TaxID=2259594 RepID=A0A482TLS8_9FLAO|nr:DUF2633 family protein [Flavobacterium petrolei]
MQKIILLISFLIFWFGSFIYSSIKV